MERILILTKNALAEKKLQEQLQLMNYEVLCHQGSSIEDLVYSDGSAFLDHFHCLIVSESLSQFDYQRILKDLLLHKKHIVVLRKSEDFGSLKESDSNFIPTNASFEKLREILVERLGFPQESKSVNRTDMIPKQLERIQWTTKEKELFDFLCENAGTPLNREEICKKIWGRYTNSTKAQLSTMIKRIREKLELSGIGGQKLVTLWGRGYQLDVSLREIYR